MTTSPTTPSPADAFTPGPWRLAPCSHGGMILLRGKEQPIEERHPQSHLQIIPEADARLIASAPRLHRDRAALLEALKELVNFCDEQNPGPESLALGLARRLPQARAAIALVEAGDANEGV